MEMSEEEFRELFLKVGQAALKDNDINEQLKKALNKKDYKNAIKVLSDIISSPLYQALK